ELPEPICGRSRTDDVRLLPAEPRACEPSALVGARRARDLAARQCRARLRSPPERRVGRAQRARRRRHERRLRRRADRASRRRDEPPADPQGRGGAMRRAALLLLVAAPLALAEPARAADDGGTRSVFAGGAGNRGLAMGSAFGAFADDASAAL